MTIDFFIEMAWKSSLICVAALGLAWALRHRAPADRATVLRIGVMMLLILPVLAVAGPALEIVAWAAPAAPEPVRAVSNLDTQRFMPQLAQLTPAEASIWDDPAPLLLLMWLSGVGALALRLAAGLATLSRWTRGGAEVTDPEWQALLARLSEAAGARRPVRLVMSDQISSPLSWGWRRPVVLIDRDTFEEVERAEAILAHELAHVVRRDWPALLLSRAAAGLFWFNPLAWLLEREAVQQAEEAADCAASARIAPTEYAQTLLTWAQIDRRVVPANSIAPGSALGRRVRAVLDGRGRLRAGTALARAAMVGCIALAVPLASVELVAAPTVPAPPAPPAMPAPRAAPVAPVAPAVPAALSAPAVAPVAVPPAPPMAARAPEPPAGVSTVSAAPPVPPVAPTPRVAPAPMPPAAPGTPVPAAAPRIPAETLAALRSHGVESRELRELSAIGSRFANLSADELAAMRVHGVTARYVRALADAGYAEASVNQLVALRVHGISAKTARRAAARAGRQLSADELLAISLTGQL